MIDFIKIKTHKEFEKSCLDTFSTQYKNNKILRQYTDLTKRNPRPTSLSELTFLPIDFFKSKEVKTDDFTPEAVFSSSSTSGIGVSKHFVKDLSLYETSFTKGFDLFYGNVSKYLILALLPSYLERSGSSLIYMAKNFISKSKYKESGFFLDDYKALHKKLNWAENNNIPTLLLGVTYALLDFSTAFPQKLNNSFVMETGGMKGRKKEMTRPDVHQILKNNFGLNNIHSEYGMTELLSQAYSNGGGIFECPPWMNVLIRDPSDPFHLLENGKTGGVNIIDLANQNSCSFIATQDLGKKISETQFEVLGRFDNSDVRGCNLLAV